MRREHATSVRDPYPNGNPYFGLFRITAVMTGFAENRIAGAALIIQFCKLRLAPGKTGLNVIPDWVNFKAPITERVADSRGPVPAAARGSSGYGVPGFGLSVAGQ
jgi:hypothetical protein